ncbi:MFS transporter [Candidatus Pseudothioglobus singularis]|nr:MFS transporter [Candidatus Pseudothioglobus singularis]MDB4598647.1 MFS transporter [Candidatus Pseudothioglobus singularis]MDC1064973.1 MFS transporter [Candidatus Pseudothioglobus singularis]
MDNYILPKKQAITVFFVFAFGYFLSCLLRSITATLSPVLTLEFDLMAADLGLLAGGYFLGFACMQIPIGFLLDKFGPKKIVSSFLLIAFIGTVSFALAQSFSGLLASRILIGVGVSACLMAPLTGYRIWFAKNQQQRANSWMLMIASLGFLSSTLPVQLLLPALGWRWMFGGVAALILISIVLMLAFIPKWDHQKDESLDSSSRLGSFADVWKNKFFISVIPMGLLNYGGLMAIQTLWAGPWMTRVAGYSPLESATGLFWINITMLVSFFLWGYFLPKITNLGFSAFKILKLGLPLSFLVILTIILLGPKAGTFYIALFILSSIFLSVIQPAVGLSFQSHLAGKALTSFNLLIFLGTFIMQWFIGLVIDLVKGLGYSEIIGFKTSFSVFLLLSLMAYIFFLIINRKPQSI